MGIPFFTAYELGKEHVKGNNSNSTLKELTSMDQTNHLHALHNIDNKILNIGIIVGGVLFSTGVLICFCFLCGYEIKRRKQKALNQLRNLNAVDEESQVQKTFLRTLSLPPTYEKAVFEDDWSKIETPPPTYHNLFFSITPIINMKSISEK